MKSDATIQDGGDVSPNNISSVEIGSTPDLHADPITKMQLGVSSGSMTHPVMSTETNSFFSEPRSAQQIGREMATEVASRLLIWMADGRTLHERGLRTSVAIYCIRPDLLEGATLEQIGTLAGCSRQAVHKLAGAFRQTTGMQK